MRRIVLSRNLSLVTGAALLAACASVDNGVGWNLLPPGSTWQVAQHNTGSYGKDVTYQITRGTAVWDGKQAVTITNSLTGATIMSQPDGRWMAAVSRDGKTLATWDPPIGYIYPLKVGQTWSTKHKMTTAGGSTEITYSCKVEAREPVTVPAGTFDSMKIVCDSPIQHDVSWTSVELGVHPKQELRRLEKHPQGPGTQQNQLVAVNRR